MGAGGGRGESGLSDTAHLAEELQLCHRQAQRGAWSEQGC